MATTTTYSFTKPTVGGDSDAWGGYLNANWDKVDDLLDGTTAIAPNLTAGSWKVGGTAITSTGAELNILDGVTATAAQINATASGYCLGAVTTLTGSGTYTVPTGARALRVWGTGGGGGGGGVAGSASGVALASCGGGGSSFELWINEADLEASYTYSVGAGGAGGTAGANDGSAGSDTTFAGAVKTATAGGGAGGAGSSATTGNAGTAGGTSGDATITGFTGVVYPGTRATDGRVVGGVIANYSNGGGSIYCAGRTRSNSAATGLNGSGSTLGYGLGGTGIFINNSATNVAGGSGSEGIIKVEVYY